MLMVGFVCHSNQFAALRSGSGIIHWTIIASIFERRKYESTHVGLLYQIELQLDVR